MELFDDKFIIDTKQSKNTETHAIRHSYAMFVLKTTKNLEAVRRLLGHSDYKKQSKNTETT